MYFRGLRGKGFPTDSRHSDGHKLCPSPSRHISVLIRSGIHTVFAFNWKEKISISVQLHIQIHRWRIVNQQPRFWELSGSDVSRWGLRSKTRRRATPLLPTWIYSCRSRVTVSCELPFTTNVTISTSISQTFRSWVAIFHLRQPMVFLSHNSYGMPGLAPLMNVLF